MLATRSPSLPACSISTSTLAFDQHFTRTARGILLMAEIVCGMLVWILIAGTDYMDLPALSWVMFVYVTCWIVTLSLFIIYIIGAHRRLPQVPWVTLALIFNLCCAVLHLIAAVVIALSASQANRGRHNYKCWTAATCFAFMTALCYAASLFSSYRAWKTKEEDQ
ncbi:CKLF-like MARVEL transmembrane domain-containing protein 8b [Neosynchiropus ocellatus]